MNWLVIAYTHNVLAHFGGQNCQDITKVDAMQNVQLTPSPNIEPNGYYRLVLLFLRPFVYRSCCWTRTLFAKFWLVCRLMRLSMCVPIPRLIHC